MTTTLIQGECLAEMAKLPSGSIDLILCDLPYGTTKNKWDVVIPFAPLWAQYERLIKPNGAIVLTAQSTFAYELALSNKKLFRYDLVWHKKGKATGFLNANRMPLRNHELILVFYKSLPTYNPQKTQGEPNHRKQGSHSRGTKQTNNNYGKFDQSFESEPTTDKFPLSILTFASVHPPIHPTQKPVDLMEYLIRTYTNEGETVLDNCMGSGTTGVACQRSNRNFIGIENDPHHFQTAHNRLVPTYPELD